MQGNVFSRQDLLLDTSHTKWLFGDRPGSASILRHDLLEDPGWDAAHDNIGRDIAGHDRPGGDHRAVADGDAGDDGRVGADPDILADGDGSRDQDMALTGVLVVVERGQDDVVADQGAVTDHDAALILEPAAGVDEYVLPDADVFAIIGVEGREQAEGIVLRLTDEFKEELAHHSRLMILVVELHGDLERALARGAHGFGVFQAGRDFSNILVHRVSPRDRAVGSAQIL